MRGFSFPYKSLIRDEEPDKEDEDREFNPGHKQRKDETSKVLVYNSYIYPTLGEQRRQNRDMLFHLI